MKLKTIICLANSRKHHGRCIAGIELVDSRSGDWVRPVSARPSHEVSEEERNYEDGSGPQVLHVVDVPVLRYEPHEYQTENWLLDPEYYWVKRGHVEWEDLDDLESDPSPLWSNEAGSSYNGTNDRV